MTAAGPPAGFTPFAETGGYIGVSGPYYWRRLADGGVDYGFRSDARHGNPNGVLHGAAIVTFVDTILGHTIVDATGRPCATISLDTRFVAGVPVGGWISGSVRTRKLTRSLALLDAEAHAGDTLLLTAGAIFRLFGAPSG